MTSYPIMYIIIWLPILISLLAGSKQEVDECRAITQALSSFLIQLAVRWKFNSVGGWIY